MGKKGSKRKTRWRTLSIGAPPGEEDEEEGLRNGYGKTQENDTGTTHTFDRNGQSGYKPRRTASGTSGTSGYGSSGARSHRNESSGSPSQPKIIFNEDEYTRITTPRQDVLFKKGYLSRKKPWASTASTSATPSTTESQSASHSTADGSETTEDQQLLDRDSGAGENPPMVKPGAQLGYGTFYDHASGYYYEYPVMLVGPAPVPAQVGPSVLAAVPCGPVPLRPIEWINPAFVPKLSGPPCCLMGYQEEQSVEGVPSVDEQESTLLLAENTNGTCGSERGAGSASCNGSVAGENEENAEESNAIKEHREEDQGNGEPTMEEHQTNEHLIEEQHLENGINGGGPYLEPVLMQQPVHVSHMIPAVPQPYMYPGHYMFGPSLVNVNGVTIQSGPMNRTTDVAAMKAACAKRRKKKKTRKQRRPALGNPEDEEEGEYSSDCDNGLPSSRPPWTGCPTSSPATNRPLNPECQEFQLRTDIEPHISLTTVPTSDEMTTSEENSITNQSSTLSSDTTASVNETSASCNGIVTEDSTNQEGEQVADRNTDQILEPPLESGQLTMFPKNGLNETDRLTYCLAEKNEALESNQTIECSSGARTDEEAPPRTDINKSKNDVSSANHVSEGTKDEMRGTSVLSNVCSECPEKSVMNGNANSDSYTDEVQTSNVLSIPKVISSQPSSCINDDSKDRLRSRSSTPKIKSTITSVNAEARDVEQGNDASNVKAYSVPKRKYSTKGLKFIREPTPGPDLNNVTNPDLENEKVAVCNTMQNLDHVDVPNFRLEGVVMMNDDSKHGDHGPNHFTLDDSNHQDKVVNNEALEGSNEDSGFESQSRPGSEYPITEAVTEWLRRANSPDVFITSAISSDSEMEDENDMDEEPPKNLLGNPMPALSANSDAGNVPLSRVPSCGEFARTSNIKNDQMDTNNASAVSRKKRDVKGTKRKSVDRVCRRARSDEGRAQIEVVSSSDSCSQQDDSINTVRKKNLPKQDVGEVCEFTEKDSVVGMRVASNSRMDSKRVNAKRTKRVGRSNRNPIENIDMKMRRIEDADDEHDEGIVEDTVNVRTFEKGEIIVSESGKLLTPSSYEPILYAGYEASTGMKTIYKTDGAIETQKSQDGKRSSSGEEETGSAIVSLNSIEEPDVLECWEAETIEPVITPKKMLQSRGILCEGEAAEEDNSDDERANIEYVQKNYRLARDSSSSTEKDENELMANITSSTYKTLPNSPEHTIGDFTSEEIPIPAEGEKQNGIGEDKKIPIEEAFEVYESCYTGKTQFVTGDSKIFKPRTLHGQDGDGPIPCKAVCCSIQ